MKHRELSPWRVAAVCGSGVAVVVLAGTLNLVLGLLVMLPVYEFCERLLSGE